MNSLKKDCLTIVFCNEIWANIFYYLDFKTTLKLETIPFFQYLLNLNIREINDIYNDHLLEKIGYHYSTNTDDYILDNLLQEYINENLNKYTHNFKYIEDVDTISYFEHDSIRSMQLKILLS